MKRDGEEDPVIVLDSDNEEPANSEHEGVRPLPAIVVDEEDNRLLQLMQTKAVMMMS